RSESRHVLSGARPFSKGCSWASVRVCGPNRAPVLSSWSMATPATQALRESLSVNLSRVRERIAHACAKARRDPASVSLVAVTKYVGASLAASLLELGQGDSGENGGDRIVDLEAALAGRAEP